MFSRKSNFRLFSVALLIPVLFVISCSSTYYFQNIEILTNRKTALITTSEREHRFFEVEISGSYSKFKPAEFTQGKHTDYVAANHVFDNECYSDPECDTSSVNNVPFTWDNIHLFSTTLNGNLQVGIVPVFRKTDTHIFRLKIISDAQIGISSGKFFLNMKTGPILSVTGKHIAFHPKLLFGYSKTHTRYDIVSYYGYGDRWDSYQGFLNAFEYLTEIGTTLEIILNRHVSIFTDINRTHQKLFEFKDRDNTIDVTYAEFSPGLRLNPTDYFSILCGVSVPYSSKLTRQLPAQMFIKFHSTLGHQTK